MAEEQPNAAFWQQHQAVQPMLLTKGESTLVQRSLSRHHLLSHDVSLMMGLTHYQLFVTQDAEAASSLSDQQRFHEWTLGFAWHGVVETRLWLAHGDDVWQRSYGLSQADETRMMLGVGKTFGF